jgi:hypothetical protein
MKIAHKSVLVLMVLQILAFSVMAHAGLLPTSSTARSAGCHEHSQKNPLPQQKSYVCCLSGHDSLILQSSNVVAPNSDSFLTSATSDPVIAGVRLESSRPRFNSSGDPPINTALRI